MDFEKIYADFKAAKAANDLEKMSDIFAQVQKFCDTLAQAGRANEIPPSAFRIARHVYVMLYRVTKLLRGGDVDKAKFYMLVLANNNAANFDTFFFLLYLLGKTFYATGDYSWAAKCFERYEKVRAINFGDVDELALFYRANCLAQLGDFNAAAELYEKILAIKSDFPEAKKNLG
ncbi:MAG: tetratricopeptide repeat protein, partial [Selenomonadaceae bacterium]|nr:tetratricopeptide repeat protein [Selenomonadaceae bacterium]